MGNTARILLLCDDRRSHANTVLDHINAFRRFSRHQVRTFNPKAMRRTIALDLDEFDVVVIHYSLILSESIYVSSDLRDKLRRFRGLKVQFLQDDYRWVDQATAAARDLGIGVLFTIAPEPAASQLYGERLPGVRRVETLTGYVPDALVGRALRPLGDRTIDVGYRARDLPFWFGALSREKAVIGQRFLELSRGYGLRCDIGWREEDRIYGGSWIDFISSCRATLGCESGASIADFDGSVEKAVRAYLRANPAASYEAVHEAVLLPYEGNVVVHVVSPRVFEAASLGTAMIMFPGEYSGVVAPGEHYIRLEKDFSNMDAVVAQLRDDDLVSKMTARTYNDLIRSGRYSYRSFIEAFDQVIDEEAPSMRGPARAPRWVAARVERTLRVPGVGVRLLRGVHSVWRRAFARDGSMRFAIEYDSQVEKAIFAMRIVLAERDLRSLLLKGRRSGEPLDRLLREIMEISLLRKAVHGDLVRDQNFSLQPEFDPVRKSLCFVSTPLPVAGGDMQVSREAVLQALRAGELIAIEWDHRALGGKVHLDRPSMVVGIGYEGLENFGALTRIGRDHPTVLERAIAPALRSSGTDRASDSVG